MFMHIVVYLNQRRKDDVDSHGKQGKDEHGHKLNTKQNNQKLQSQENCITKRS